MADVVRPGGTVGVSPFGLNGMCSWVGRIGDGSGPRQKVVNVSPEGVRVAWEGRKGSYMDLSWQQSRNMLVRVGRLARREDIPTLQRARKITDF